MNRERETIQVGDITIRPNKTTHIAGPCAVESEDQMFTTARALQDAQIDMLRGGAFKPRSNPDSFQGIGELGLKYLFAAGKELQVPVVTEVMEISQIDIIKKVAAGHPFIYQIGSRNAQNYSLLTAVGETGVPVMLKRGKGSTVSEMLGAAQYITKGGSPVLMCERGIVTFSSGDPHKDVGRFTADYLAITKFQEAGYLTIFDPSHAAGLSRYVIKQGLAAIASNADGIILEVHHQPAEALCDKEQALTPEEYASFIHQARAIENIVRHNQ